MTHVLPRGIARGAALLGLCLALGLGGCDTVSDLFDDSDEAPLTGNRLSVISLERQLEPDPGADLLTVRLPPPYVNEDWPQAGGYPHHAMHHLAAADVLAEAWRVRIGRGTDDDGPALSPPVIAGGRVFTMDSRSLISAFDATTGARLWTADTRPEDDDEGAFGGGLALAGAGCSRPRASATCLRWMRRPVPCSGGNPSACLCVQRPSSPAAVSSP